MKTKGRERVRVRRWTKEEYYRLGEQGFFQGQRVELIEGRLMVMSPLSVPNANAVELITYTLTPLFRPAFRVRIRLPFAMSATTEPEPDFLIQAVAGLQNPHLHPTTADLLVEVSDSSLSYDRKRKGSLYARAGVADYWIVNLVARQLEVYRDPIPDAAQPFGWKYATRTDLKAPATISPLILPGQSIAVADLVP
jgi:Uma2 family endonuclease